MTSRRTILITHATPEDNLFASWLASRLTAAGYHVWVDLQDLSAGGDFWQEIESKLRNDAFRQIVLVSKHIRKDGVQKELALGDRVKKDIKDPKFILPIRIDDIAFGDFPVELIRLDSLDAYPNWASCLAPLLKALTDDGVPRAELPDHNLVEAFVNAREQGRRVLHPEPEKLVTNWFPLTTLPEKLTLVTGRGTNVQFDAWLKGHPLPHVPFARLAGLMTDAATFADAHPNGAALDTLYAIPLAGVLDGSNTGPFVDQRDADNHIVNLLRQHWNAFAKRRGLLPFEFANGQVGWFFPDGLIESRTTFQLPSGESASRLFSGKFKDRRWHLCLLAKPRLWPTPAFRVHANLVLTEDGKTPLPGDKTHKLRKRLTKSWWNDKWRDLLLASMAWLAEGEDSLDLAVGDETFKLAAYPLETEIVVSYPIAAAPPTEETDEGEIIQTEELDAPGDGIGDDEEAA